MADSTCSTDETRVLKLDDFISNSLLGAMLPINVILEFKNNLMPTNFATSTHWRSLLVVGQSQVQRSGLLFQVGLTYASMEKQILYVMTKEFTRIPPTTHGLPKMKTGNMANITFKYCQEIKSLKELLIGFCKTPTELLPDVLVVNGLNEYKGGKDPPTEFHMSKIMSLLSETAEYIGRRKQSTILLYMSLGLAATPDKQKDWLDMLNQWCHEVWVLEGNSNRLVCGNIQVQFTVLGSNINLKTVSRVD